MSSKCSPPELRSYFQNQGRVYLLRTLPQVNPEFSVSQIFSGTNPLALVGTVLARWVSTVSGRGGQGEILGKVLLALMLNLTYAKFD